VLQTCIRNEFVQEQTMTGIILSGGENSRMGANKAFLTRDGERLIDRTVKIFKDLFREVILVTNDPLEYLDLDVQIVTDIYKRKKALGGIYTGLFYTSCGHAFVAACDMPFLNQRFIAYMMEQIRDYDIIVPQTADGLQPLHAIYSRRCLPAIKNLLLQDKLKITGFYKGLKHRCIPEKIIKTFDPEFRMFLNINTPEDMNLL
jgi:molybdopterin-guanine dinucleotide biosynthesis protein A